VTSAYRQKLLNWFISMLISIFLFVMLTTYYWFIKIPTIAEYGEYDDLMLIETFTWPLGNVAAIMAPAFIWHFGDFMQKEQTKVRLGRLFDQYRNLIFLLVAYGFASWLVISPSLDDLGCPTFISGFDGCGSSTPMWQILLRVIIFIFIYLVAIGKLGISIASRVRKP